MEQRNNELSVVMPPMQTRNHKEKNHFWHINREMLPYKLHYFLFTGGMAAINPFLSAFGITELGLTASNITVCFTALHVAKFVLKPVFGYIADYFNRLKAVIVGLALLHILFCFFILIIRNTGMPATMEVTHSYQDASNCQICFNSDKFKLFTPNYHLVEEKDSKILACFSSSISENSLINCSSEYTKSTYSNNSCFEIHQTTCNSSYTDVPLSEIYTELESVPADVEYIHIFNIKSSQMFVISIFPREKKIYHANFHFQDLNQYCYALVKESVEMLQHLLEKSNRTPTDCIDLHKSISLQKKNKHNESIANITTYQFWAFTICFVLISTFSCSQFTMSDAACYKIIKDYDFGHQRTWGCIGWGLVAPFSGYLNDYTGSYMVSWCLCVCFIVLEIWNLSRMNLLKPELSQNILKDVKMVFKSVDFLCFEAGVLLNGVFYGIIWYHLTWFIISIDGNEFIIGLVHAVQNFFGEVPAFYFSGWLIKKLGHFNLVSLALISHGIRFFLYSFLYNPWWILPIECLHGFTYGSFYSTITSFGEMNSKPGTEATTQSILCTTFKALGSGLGVLGAGFCLEYFGGHTTFFYVSILCVAATIINVFNTFIIRCRKGSLDITESSINTKRY